MEELYNMTHINNNLNAPFTIFSTIKNSVNFTIENIELDKKEIMVNKNKQATI